MDGVAALTAYCIVIDEPGMDRVRWQNAVAADISKRVMIFEVYILF